MDSGSRYSSIRRRHKVLAFLRLIRGNNLAMIALGQLLCAWRLVYTPWYTTPLGLRHMGILLLSTCMCAAAGYIINDYYDVKIDVLNKPKRVVVGRFISRRVAMVWHLVLGFVSIGLATLVSIKIGALVAFCFFWLWLYSNRLKRLPFVGNFSIAILTSLSILLPGIAFYPPKKELYLFALFAFWMTLIREIIKDLEDRKGDARHGCITLPIIWGIPKTRQFLNGLGVVFLLTFGGSMYYLPNQWWFATLALGIPMVWLFYKLQFTDTSAGFSELSKLCKQVMLGGLASLLLL